MIKVEKLNPFGRMCISLGMLPSSYKESLTYEEQLLWFFKYLDETVIPTLNNNAMAIEEVQALYLQLKEYVDNYFENLDVQEEINNKLDDMAESGELTEIIAQYLSLAGVIAFDTVADMKAAENIVDGSICRTLGYSTYNDKKGSYYKIRTMTSGDVADEINIIALTTSDTLIAEKINNQYLTYLYPYYDVLKNGGYADGTTANDSIISAALTAGFKKFYFPQNDSNNASYYFNEIPELQNCEIKTDEGVILNLPWSRGRNKINNAIFHNNVIKYSRESSNNTIIPSVDEYLFNTLSYNYDYVKRYLRPIQFNDASLKCYHYKYNNDYLFEEVDKTTYYESSDILINRKSGSTNGYFNGLCIPIDSKRNTIESCANGKLDFVVFDSSTNSGMFCTWNNTTFQLDAYTTSGTATALQKINMSYHNSGTSMTPSYQCIYKIRYNKQENHLEFYINDLLIAVYTPSFTPTHFGFGRNSNSNTVTLSRFLTYQSNNVPINANLKILIAGDSRFAGAGSTYSINKMIEAGLKYNGINKVEIDNISVDGLSISQIYSALQDTTLSNYDIVIIETGINNYNSTSNTIAGDMYNISTLLKSAGTFNIFTACMPTGWNGSDANANVRSENYYRIKNAMEIGIASAANWRETNFILENNCGNTTNASNIPICSDGVHPNDLGLIEITRNIVNGIFSMFKDEL